jgi:hypothetical protein
MPIVDPNSLKPYARKYIWWETPEQAVDFPERVMAQVMNMGDFYDVQRMANMVGDDTLRGVVTHAQAGWFNARSWHYWHYRLGLSQPEQVPPLPRRTFS